MRLPNSNIPIAVRKTILSGKNLYTFPQLDCDDATVKKNAEAYLRCNIKVCSGHHVWNHLPSNVIEAVEVGCNFRNRSWEDCLHAPLTLGYPIILWQYLLAMSKEAWSMSSVAWSRKKSHSTNQKHAEDKSHYDHYQIECLWIILLILSGLRSLYGLLVFLVGYCWWWVGHIADDNFVLGVIQRINR